MTSNDRTWKEGSTVETLAETETFKVVYNAAADPIQAALDGKPNFFVLHKQTGRCEASVESVVAALDILNIATDNLKKINDEAMKGVTVQ